MHTPHDTETPETIPAAKWGLTYLDGAQRNVDETLRICDQIAQRSAERIQRLAQEAGQ